MGWPHKRGTTVLGYFKSEIVGPFTSTQQGSAVAKILLTNVEIIQCTITNVDIKFRVHDTFLEYPSSGMLKVERLESQII